jgi:hydroxyacylglutathione hydrolase
MSEPAVHLISVPNPYFEGTNSVYLIESDPLTLIDSGMCFDDARDVLERGLAEHGYKFEDIGQLILTHKHVDHVGQAAAVQERSGAKVYIHAHDRAEVQGMEAGHQRFVANIRDLLTRWGVPLENMRALAGSMETNGWTTRSVVAEELQAGDRIPLGAHELEVIHTPGHTLGCICLRMGRYLFTGDTVLPDISPNVGGGDLERAGLLRKFFDSLERVRALQESDTLAMPGHGAPFATLDARCRALLDHHRFRLDQITTLLADGQPRTVYEVASALFGTMRHIHLMLGTAEAHSHLEYLAEEGAIRAEGERFVKA